MCACPLPSPFFPYLPVLGRLQDVHGIVPGILSFLGPLQALQGRMSRSIADVWVCLGVQKQLGLEVHVILHLKKKENLRVQTWNPETPALWPPNFGI